MNKYWKGPGRALTLAGLCLLLSGCGSGPSGPVAQTEPGEGPGQGGEDWEVAFAAEGVTVELGSAGAVAGLYSPTEFRLLLASPGGSAPIRGMTGFVVAEENDYRASLQPDASERFMAAVFPEPLKTPVRVKLVVNVGDGTMMELDLDLSGGTAATRPPARVAEDSPAGRRASIEAGLMQLGRVQNNLENALADGHDDQVPRLVEALTVAAEELGRAGGATSGELRSAIRDVEAVVMQLEASQQGGDPVSLSALAEQLRDEKIPALRDALAGAEESELGASSSATTATENAAPADEATAPPADETSGEAAP